MRLVSTRSKPEDLPNILNGQVARTDKEALNLERLRSNETVSYASPKSWRISPMRPVSPRSAPEDLPNIFTGEATTMDKRTLNLGRLRSNNYGIRAPMVPPLKRLHPLGNSLGMYSKRN